MSVLAAILNARGRPDEGVIWNRKAYDTALRGLGPEHQRTRDLKNNLAFSLTKAGQSQEAEKLFRELLETARREGKMENPAMLITIQSFSNLLRSMGKLEESEALARHVLDTRRKILPPEHPGLGDATQLLGRIRYDQKDPGAAEGLFRQALAIHEKSLPSGSWRTAVTRCDLAKALIKLARFEEAQNHLLEAHATLLRTPNDHPREILDTLLALANLYDAWNAAKPGTGADEKAAEWRAKLAAWQATTQPATTQVAASQPLH